MVAVKSSEFPAINITDDGLLECRYQPYKTRNDTNRKRQKKYLVTNKGHSDKKYRIYPVHSDKHQPPPLWCDRPCHIIRGSTIIVANPDTGKLEVKK